MHDVITIGSALVDIYVHSDKFQKETVETGSRFSIEGDKVEIESLRVVSGGGGSNCAVGFSRLGFQTGVISEIGVDDFAQIVLHDFRKEKVMTNMIIREKKEQTGGSVLMVGNDGSRTAMVHRGAASMLDPQDISPYWIAQTKWVHLGSIAGQLKTLKKIFELVKKSLGTTLSWNPGKKELALLVDGKIKVEDIPARILFLNQYEWDLVGDLQDELIKEIPQIVITRGKDGGDVYIHGRKELKFFGSQAESIVEETGAGDAFATGYTAGQILNKDPRTSVEWGVRNAGSVIQFYGAKVGLLRRDQIEDQTQRSV